MPLDGVAGGVPSGRGPSTGRPGPGRGVGPDAGRAHGGGVGPGSWASAENRYMGRSPVIASSHSAAGTARQTGRASSRGRGRASGGVGFRPAGGPAASTASRPTTPDRLTPSLDSAIDARWLWASMNRASTSDRRGRSIRLSRRGSPRRRHGFRHGRGRARAPPPPAPTAVPGRRSRSGRWRSGRRSAPLHAIPAGFRMGGVAAVTLWESWSPRAHRCGAWSPAPPDTSANWCRDCSTPASRCAPWLAPPTS